MNFLELFQEEITSQPVCSARELGALGVQRHQATMQEDL